MAIPTSIISTAIKRNTTKYVFFRILKTEMFYVQEDNYKIIDDLIKAIDDYIY